MRKVNDEGLLKVVQTYNDEGRLAAYDLLRDHYGVKKPYYVLKRIQKNPMFEYDKEKDCYQIHDESKTDGLFMSMDELCSPVASPRNMQAESRPDEMEQLIRELLGDRLLELSRYITLESSSRTMIIDQTSLKNAGYRVITH
jgi:hypothetical protein